MTIETLSVIEKMIYDQKKTLTYQQVIPQSEMISQGVDLPNLALNKPTDQISTFGNYTSDLAVDGTKNTNISAGSCSHTNRSCLSPISWWQVDLQQIILFLTVSVTNRGDCCHDRLTNFSVEVHISDPRTSTDSGHQLCYWHEGTVGKGQTVDMDCAVNTIGRYMRIVKYCFYDKPLTLCEVEIHLSGSVVTLQWQGSLTTSSPGMKNIGKIEVCQQVSQKGFLQRLQLRATVHGRGQMRDAGCGT
ncbi:fucolectin-like [Haliotis rubra]|uniref:fucolectin-like n=1 Tax=Haliotis rubra TaxID=36100 RepID=UPI001EE5C07D|nr:fucolectin-like [Haliotis rubra]